ncbi:hypothetical protein [Polaribacter staleyi]|uniref:hypothetical protein n=1 Tax=Polaribacter staleyi TaxID=2022337 RepID=UPI0031BA61D4
MKILILVPDGVGVRNYLYSSFTSNLIKAGNEVLIYHKLSESAIQEIKKSKPEITNFEVIPDFIEKPKARLLREALAYARLLRNEKTLKNGTILKFWSPSKKGIKKKILYFLAEFSGFILSKSYSLIRKGDHLYEKELSKSSTIEIIKNTLLDFKPDFILNLHQRSPLTSPIISAAKKLQISTATVIFSWDNVPKARLISRYDYYYVWSDLMKNQLLQLYPEILTSQIQITGTPQFEFYGDKNLYEERNIFLNKYGLDIDKKTICFSGNDLSSPYDAVYLNDICEELFKLDEKIRPQILFRRCPVDMSDRFDIILNKYKEFVFSIDPDWKIAKEEGDSFTSIYPSTNDNRLLVNTVKHSDIVINLGSTMAHDFAILDKPCLYLNYDPVDHSKFKVEDVFNFEHFRSMNHLEAVGWIHSKNEISNRISEVLQNPEKVGKERKEWLKRIVLHPIEGNSNKLIEKILECTSVS